MNITLMLDQIQPGMILNRPVINENGKIILSEGIVLSDSVLLRLQSMGITQLDIRLHDNPASMESQFADSYSHTISAISDSFEKIRYFKEVPLAQMNELVERSVNPMIEIPSVLLLLSSVQQFDDYTFQHSLNVAVISGILGKWQGLTGDKLKNLVAAGLLHDIGKLKISENILTKPGPLSPEEHLLMQRHPVDGYQMLASAPNVSQEVLLGVLQHHERIDGTGYPMGKMAEKIHLFAKIIAIADIYAAMTSDHAYRDRQTPFDAAYIINRDMFQKLDAGLCLTFLEHVRDSLLGNIVVLSDGRKAKVISAGGTASISPIVITEENEILDFKDNPSLKIAQWTNSTE